MTRDEVLEMARQAGFVEYELDDGTLAYPDIRYVRFAALVAERTREECARVCESTSPRHTECQNKIAASIRSMPTWKILK